MLMVYDGNIGTDEMGLVCFVEFLSNGFGIIHNGKTDDFLKLYIEPLRARSAVLSAL